MVKTGRKGTAIIVFRLPPLFYPRVITCLPPHLSVEGHNKHNDAGNDTARAKSYAVQFCNFLRRSLEKKNVKWPWFTFCGDRELATLNLHWRIGRGCR